MHGTFTINQDQVGRAKFRVEGKLGGKRIRKFFRTREAAENYARARNTEVKNHGLAASEMPTWLRAEAMRCHELLAAVGATLSDAAADYLKNHDQRSNSLTIAEAGKRYRIHCERRVASREIKGRTWDTMRRQVAKLERAFSQKLVCDLAPLQIEEWINSLSVGTVSKNTLRVNLSGFFTYTTKFGWTKSNPISRIEVKYDHAAATKLPDILSVGQAAKLMETAPAHLVPSIAIGLFAGLRPAEVQRLDWSEILWEKRLVHVAKGKAKTAQPRWVPMSQNLVAWLAPYRKPFGPLSELDEWNACRAISAAGRSAGIDKWPKDGLRHSYGSYELARSENGGATAERMGHMSTKMLYEHYNHRVMKEQAHAYFNIFPADAGAKILAMA